MKRDLIFEAVGEVDDAYVLAAADFLEALEQKARRRRKTRRRTLLIAAAVAATMAVTAFAAEVFGLTARLIPPPVENTGTEQSGAESGRIFISQNGLTGSDEFKATGEWQYFREQYSAQMTAEQGDGWIDRELSFAGNDDRLRSTCFIYGVQDEAMWEKLQEISEKYALRLYTDQVTIVGEEDFSALTGAEPFLPEGNRIGGGYVFADGAFKLEGSFDLEGTEIIYAVNRTCEGALYPYSLSIDTGREYEEWQYTTQKGYALSFAALESRTMIYYEDGQGRFISFSLTFPDTASHESAQAFAEYVDLDALLKSNTRAEEIIGAERGAAENRDALQVMEDFYNSPMFQACREFSSFYTANFYGSRYTGPYGLPGYEDISAEMDRLCEKYGLVSPGEKHRGIKDYPDAEVYGNGAFRVSLEEGELHYIPKNALYTGLWLFVEYAEYSRVWRYETAQGETVYCAMNGPEKRSAPHILFETEDAYVLLFTKTNDANAMEKAADSIRFAAFGEEEK